MGSSEILPNWQVKLDGSTTGPAPFRPARGKGPTSRPARIICAYTCPASTGSPELARTRYLRAKAAAAAAQGVAPLVPESQESEGGDVGLVARPAVSIVVGAWMSGLLRPS